VTFELTATVQEYTSSAGEVPPALSSLIGIGGKVCTTYAFEPWGVPERVDHHGSHYSLNSMTVEAPVSNVAWRAPRATVAVYDNASHPYGTAFDNYMLSSGLLDAQVGGLYLTGMGVRLWDSGGTAFSNEALGDMPPSLADFDPYSVRVPWGTYLSLLFQNGREWSDPEYRWYEAYARVDGIERR
jgi:hypothetical protein